MAIMIFFGGTGIIILIGIATVAVGFAFGGFGSLLHPTWMSAKHKMHAIVMCRLAE